MASEKECMLTSTDDFEFGSNDEIYVPKRETSSRRWITVLLILLLASSTTNVILFFKFIGLERLRQHVYPIYSGIPIDTIMTYTSSNDYWDPAKPYDRTPDAFWDALETRPIAVAIDQSWAAEHNLPSSDAWPWDDEKGLYYIKAFHTIHCLKIIRQAYHYAIRGENFTIPSHHLDHCFDALRQDALCRADDTPMPVNATEGSIGNGQQLQCRDWNKLVEWTQHSDRQACYFNFGDYQDVRPALELFAFCPKDSKYYDVMSRYFERFGHKELYVSTE